MTTDKVLRLFFALPCPPEQAAAISHWRAEQRLNGRPVPPENFHLTLAFLGAQPHTRLEALRQLAEAVESPGFELSLNSLTTLGKGFVCLQPDSPPAALLQLAATLEQRLSALGIVLDSRRFLPHLTLARQAGPPLQSSAPRFTWAADHFALFLSEISAKGVHYRELGSWPLQKTNAAS